MKNFIFLYLHLTIKRMMRCGGIIFLHLNDAYLKITSPLASSLFSDDPSTYNPRKMNVKSPIAAKLALGLLVAVFAYPLGFAQQVKPEQSNETEGTSAATEGKNDDIVIMETFIVDREREHGYQATSTLAGTRMATLLKETSAAISVITKDFMNDVGITDIAELASWGPNTYVDESHQESNFTESLVSFSRPVVTRGFVGKQSMARNYFISIVPSDAFETSSIDLAYGPNAALFGEGSLGGLVSVGSKRARLDRNSAEVEVRPDTWGGMRTSMDANASIGRYVAIRTNFLYDDSKGWRDAQFSERRATQISLTIQPFKNTMISVEYSGGHGESGAPRENYHDGYSTWLPYSNWDWSDTSKLAADYSNLIDGPYYTTAQYNRIANNEFKWADGFGYMDTSGATNGNRNNYVAPVELGLGRGVGTDSSHLVFMSNNSSYDPSNYIPLMDWQPAIRSNGLGLNYPIYPTVGENMSVYTNREDYPMSLPDKEYSHIPKKTPWGEADWYLWGAHANYAIGNLALEAAMNLQYRGSKNFTRGVNELVYYDLNKYLPERRDAMPGEGVEVDDNLNPNAGRAFTDTQYAREYNRKWARDYRVMAAYLFRVGIMDQRLVGIVGRREDYTDRTVKGYVRTNNGSIDKNENRVWIRRYLDDGNAPIYEEPQSFGSYEIDYLTYERQLRKSRMNYYQAALAGRYWNGILNTTIGIRYDEYKEDMTDHLNGRSGIWGGSNISINPNLPDDDTNDPELRIIWRSKDPERINSSDPTARFPNKFGITSKMGGFVLWPTKWLGVFGNYSEGFTTVNRSLDIHNNPHKQPDNKGIDLGVKLEFKSKDRIVFSGRIGYYKSQSSGPSDMASGLAFNFATSTSPAGGIWDRTKAIYDELLMVTSDPQWEAKSARAEAYDKAMQTYGDTVDLDVDGWELDINISPTRSWSIVLNGAITDNAQNNSSPATKAYIAEHSPEWYSLLDNPYASEDRKNTLKQELDYVDMVMRNRVDGRPLVGTPDYTANVFTSYTFLRGPLKGLKIGGGAQFVGPRILGIHKYWDPSVDKGLDANGRKQPTGDWKESPGWGYKSDSSMLATAMLSYNFKLWRRNFLFQVNVSNLFNSDKYIYSSGIGNSTASNNYTWQKRDANGNPVFAENGSPQMEGGKQVPQGFRYTTPRKVTFTIRATF